MGGTAVVVGGGVGGLATAVALGRDGWDVTVFERQADLSGAGTAFGIWPGALHALDMLGLGDAVRRLGVAQERAEFRRPDGSRIATLDVARLRRRTGEPVRLLSRPALVRILADAVPGRALNFGGAVGDPWALRGDVDLVVAADGVFGRTRTDLFGGTYRARYAGTTAWRGWVDGMSTDTVTETWGAGVKFGTTPQEGGRTNWYAAVAAPEGSFAPGAGLTTLRGLVGAWHEPIPRLLDAMSEAQVLRHDVYVVPRLPAFVRDNVALVGDAAHAMTPDLGRGACEAIVDAVTLAASLHGASGARGVADALRRYDRQRRRPVQRLASAAAAASRLTRQRRLLPVREAVLRASLLLPVPA
jgi:2-polyprenyl-6-methoxyphenol hydroxylase-like FAD-dependent oxidoreductase